MSFFSFLQIDFYSRYLKSRLKKIKEKYLYLLLNEKVLYEKFYFV